MTMADATAWSAASSGAIPRSAPVFACSRGGYRGTSLIRNSLPLGPYGRPMSEALWWS